MKGEIAEQKAKILFISILVFFIVLLIVISYFVYVDKSDDNNDNTENDINDIKREISNLNKIIPSNIMNNNNNNNNNNNVKKIVVNEVENENNINNFNNIEEEKPADNNTWRDETNQYDNIADKSFENKIKKKQVFNISNNIFNYDEARAVCVAHGGKLATYQQVVDSYKNGGEWCNYGWSENQMALYPTQKETYKRLQRDPENANACGEWGVNGGYFENPNTLFGANCYGVKPEPKDRERSKSLPVSSREREMLARVKQYKAQLNDLTFLLLIKIYGHRNNFINKIF